MKRVFIIVIALLLALSLISCGRPTQRQVEKMIEDAVEEALEEQAEENEKDEKDEDEDEKEDDNDNDNADSGSFALNYAGEEIPEDFPSKDVPLYESRDAEVVGAVRASAEESVTYQLGIGTNEKMKDVAEDIKKELEKMYSGEELQKVESNAMYMYVVTAKKWTFTINVVDGAEEGYETLVTYSVLSN